MTLTPNSRAYLDMRQSVFDRTARSIMTRTPIAECGGRITDEEFRACKDLLQDLVTGVEISLAFDVGYAVVFREAADKHGLKPDVVNECEGADA